MLKMRIKLRSDDFAVTSRVIVPYLHFYTIKINMSLIIGTVYNERFLKIVNIKTMAFTHNAWHVIVS